MNREKNYVVTYTINYEPADMKTLKRLIELKSPYTPLFKIENVEYSVEALIGSVPTAFDDKDNYVWLMIDDKIFKVKLFNSKNVHWERTCLQMVNLIKLSDHQFLDIEGKVCIDFKEGIVSYKQYIKALNQNMELARQLGII